MDIFYGHKAFSEMNTKKISIVVALGAFLGLTIFVYLYLPVDVEWTRSGPFSIGYDWKDFYRPAILDLLHGKSPYAGERYIFNPPWVFISLVWVAFFSPEAGSAIMFSLNLFAFIYVAYKLKMHVVLMIFFTLFSSMLSVSVNGNIDGLVSLGFVLPPQIGLFFVLAKPQTGIAVAGFWAMRAFRNGGIKQVFKIFLPVILAFLLSFVFFGFWPMHTEWLLYDGVWWNSSIFPWGVPVGITLLFLSLRNQEKRLAIAASPFFAPYVTWLSWSVVPLGLLSLFELRKNANIPQT